MADNNEPTSTTRTKDSDAGSAKTTQHLDRDPNDPRNVGDNPHELKDLNDPEMNGDTTNPNSDHFKGETKMSPPAGPKGDGTPESDKTNK